MTRKQAKIFAKIWCATVVSNADGFMFMNNDGSYVNGISESDQYKILDEITKIGIRIGGSLPTISSTKDIYDYSITELNND